jgi:hypothetical protein
MEIEGNTVRLTFNSQLTPGTYEVYIRNPGGLEDSRGTFSVHPHGPEAELAAAPPGISEEQPQREERQRLAEEQQQQKEQQRLAEEQQLQKEQATRQKQEEQQRLAEEQQRQKEEQQRLAEERQLKKEQEARQKQEERQRLAEERQLKKEQAARQEQGERQRLAELLQQELQRRAELQRQEELQRQTERQRQAELRRQTERQRLAELQRLADIYRQRELQWQKERQQLQEERQRQEELLQQEELQRQKERQRQQLEEERQAAKRRRTADRELKKPDILVSVGYAPLLPLYGSLFTDAFEQPFFFPGAVGRIGILPFKLGWSSLGVELGASWYMLTQSAEKYDASAQVMGAQFNLLYQLLLPNRIMAFNLRMGAGVSAIRDFYFGYPNGSKSDPLNGEYLSLNAGLSFQWLIRDPLFVEAGAEFTHIQAFNDAYQPGYLRPVLSVGWQF